MSNRLKITLAILFTLVIISLGLNLFLIFQLMQTRRQLLQIVTDVKPALQETFDTVGQELETFQNSTLQFNIQIDQQVPINTDIPFNETVDVPVQVVIPVKEEIETTVMMDPFQAGLEIPVDIVVPIDMEFPIDQVVSFTVARTVPISATIPLSLTVPINIDINNTDLAPYVEQLREGLDTLEKTVDETLNTME